MSIKTGTTFCIAGFVISASDCGPCVFTITDFHANQFVGASTRVILPNTIMKLKVLELTFHSNIALLVWFIDEAISFVEVSRHCVSFEETDHRTSAAINRQLRRRTVKEGFAATLSCSWIYAALIVVGWATVQRTTCLGKVCDTSCNEIDSNRIFWVSSHVKQMILRHIY